MGNTNTITLENKTKEVVDIIDFHRIITGKTVKAGGQIEIDSKEYDGKDSRGGWLPLLMIFCGGNLLKSLKGDYLLAGRDFFSKSLKTVTIDSTNDKNSGVVNYEVKFQQRGASGSVNRPLKFVRDSVLGHDYGWSVQFINGSVKLTREEGVTMILDPSKLFGRINDPKITSLLHMVLQFWPRTFADLKSKDDLKETIELVNALMVQARECNTNRLEGEVANNAKVIVDKLVSDLNRLCAAKVEWYRPLFPGMKLVEGQMAEVDEKKLKKFETTIECLLNSWLGRSS